MAMTMANIVTWRYFERNREEKPILTDAAFFSLRANAMASSTPSGSVLVRIALACWKSSWIAISHLGLSGTLNTKSVYIKAGIASTPSIHLHVWSKLD